MENEIWKDIPDYEGLYQVSNLGRVKSIKNKDNIKILKKFRAGNYYHGVALCKNGKKKTTAVHKLVAITFLNHKPCGFKFVIDHINDIKTDNRVENLQIVTSRYNSCKTQGKYLSKYKGVSIDKIKYKDKIYIYYRARILINNKDVPLGTYKNEYDAHLAYQEALNKYQLF
jgi:hypothetical protein